MSTAINQQLKPKSVSPVAFVSPSTNDDGILIWPRTESLCYGSIPVPPPPRLALSSVKKIINYTKTKSDESSWRRMSWSTWRHIAVNKMHLAVEYAALYMEHFILLDRNADTARMRLNAFYDIIGSSKGLEDTPIPSTSDVFVPTLEFTLFLYLQFQHKISLRSSLLSSEEWPLRARSPDLIETTRGPSPSGSTTSGISTSGRKTLDEQGQLSFVISHLQQLIQLLIERDLYGNGYDVVTMEAVEALDVLFCCSVNHPNSSFGETIKGDHSQSKMKHSLISLHELVLKPPLSVKLDYSKITKTLNAHSLESFIRAHLSLSPYGITSCLVSGKQLIWTLKFDNPPPLSAANGELEKNVNATTISDTASTTKSKFRRGKIASNYAFIDKSQQSILSREKSTSVVPNGSKVIIISQCGKQVLARDANDSILSGASIRIHRCNNAQIYLLAPLRSINVEKCISSTIVLGSVETCVHMTRCQNITIASCPKRFLVSNSSKCIIHLLTPSRPLILQGNSDLTFAPYHTHFSPLQEHLKNSGIPWSRNLWNFPLMMTAQQQQSRDSALGDSSYSNEEISTTTLEFEDSNVWQLMNPEDFCSLVIPFKEISSELIYLTDCVLLPDWLPIPQEYRNALHKRRDAIHTWQKTIRDTDLNANQLEQMQNVVQIRFREWLANSGFAQELTSLTTSVEERL